MTDIFCEISSRDLQIVLPARVIVSGQSSAGKSRMILRMLENADTIFSHKFSAVFYIFPPTMFETRVKYIEDLRKAVPHVVLIEGLSEMNLEAIKLTAGHKMVVGKGEIY